MSLSKDIKKNYSFQKKTLFFNKKKYIIYINMRNKICYRSLIMETLPNELSDKIFGKHLNCAQAHAFLS